MALTNTQRIQPTLMLLAQGLAPLVDERLGEVARELAYRLYTTSERKGFAQEALL